MASPYLKPALTYPRQLELLKERGLVVDNDNEALFYLQHLNYYRLRAYWLPFETGGKDHKLIAGTSFTTVLDLYRFDRELRLLLLDAIERVEVCMRANWAYVLGHNYGPKSYRDSSKVKSQQRHRNFLERLDRDLKNSHETFIVHFRTHYGVAEVPIWAVCEVISLGMLSRLFENLKDRRLKRNLADAVGANNEILLESWLHHLSYLRNICAHHCRLWNRRMVIAPAIPKTVFAVLGSAMTGGKKVYDSLVILLHLLDQIAPQHSWRNRTMGLILKSSNIVSRHWQESQMGFPSHWRTLPIWQGAS